MAPKITAPEPVTGSISGLDFTAGVAEVDSLDETARAVLTDHGFKIDDTKQPVTIPDGAPSTDWKGDQLKAYAEKHELDLGSAKSKPELVAAIEAADKAKADAAQTAAGNTQE